MSNFKWFQLGYGIFKLEHNIAENLAISNRHSLIDALHIVKAIKAKVENKSVSIEEALALWNKAYDLYKGINEFNYDH
jgi:hypothetical protein